VTRWRIIAATLVLVAAIVIAIMVRRAPAADAPTKRDSREGPSAETSKAAPPTSVVPASAGPSKRDAIRPAGSVALRGRVTDTLGGVVVGAVATIVQDEVSVATAVTDEHGELVAWVLPGASRVIVRAAGYAPGAARGEAPEHFFEVSLLPASTIAGRVVERGSAAPVAHARIEAVGDHGDRRSAESADDGSFRIEDAAPGSWDLEGFASGLRGYAKGAVLLGVAESTSGVVVELEHAPPVVARVLERMTHAPCTSGDVVLREQTLEEKVEASIEPNGAVHFIAVLPGTYAVEVRCEGHTRPGELPSLTIGAHPIEGVTWEVERGSVARGVVVGEGGELVPNARVIAEPQEYGATVEALSDGRGEFALRGLEAKTYALTASPRSSLTGADAALTISVSRDHDTTGLRLVLGRPSTIVGNVIDSDGRPIKSATVLLIGATARRIETHDDGSFAFTGLTPGAYRLSARAEVLADYLRVGSTQGDKPDVIVAAGETATKNVVIEGHASFAEGLVLDHNREPLAGYFVEANASNNLSGFMRWGRVRSPAVTDANGHFRIEWIGDGKAGLRAYRQGGAEGMRLGIQPGETNVVIQVSSGTLTGVVTGAPGQAKPDRLTVSVDDDAQYIWRTEAVRNANGSFTMHELPSGSYVVTVQTPEGSATANVTMTNGSNVSIELALVPHVEIRGTVVWGDDGRPVSGAHLWLVTSGASQHHVDSEATTGRDGRFEFLHAPASTTGFTVMTSLGGHATSFELGSGRTGVTISIPRDKAVD
jgi:protocatechuate 3,4-dioxygenase beta subunit